MFPVNFGIIDFWLPKERLPVHLEAKNYPSLLEPEKSWKSVGILVWGTLGAVLNV